MLMKVRESPDTSLVRLVTELEEEESRIQVTLVSTEGIIHY